LIRKPLGRTCSLFFPAFVWAVAFAAAAPLHAQQCPGHPQPAGRLVAQNISGSFTAPGKPTYDWSKSQYRLDLTKYARGGTLTIAVTLGNGPSTAIFFLLPPDVVVATDGGPSVSFPFRAETRPGDLPPGSPGSCTTIIYDFHPQVLIFGVSGDWSSPKGATNNFEFSAYVESAGGRSTDAAPPSGGPGTEAAPAEPGSILSTLSNAAAAIGEMISAGRDRLGEKLETCCGSWGPIIAPLISATNFNTARYEYCLADVEFTHGVNPASCEAMPAGRSRTTCFENQMKAVTALGDDERANVIYQCDARFKVVGAMHSLLDAGVKSLGVLYKYCKVPGLCKDPDLDSPEYRTCLYERYSLPPPITTMPLNGGLGLQRVVNYCSLFGKDYSDREKWRLCTEVAMIEQSGGEALAFNPGANNGVLAIDICRRLPQ
jgi:hypothetical protein